jgi:pimeloyl-ACP methyl ester carboxylesterase
MVTRRALVAATTGLGISLVAPTATFAQSDTSTPSVAEGAGMTESAVETGYAAVNGLQMYYEIHGSGGVPLAVIHGSFGSTGMFADLVPALAATRQVIVMDQQAHGRTADIDRPLRFEQMADDTAALLRELGIEQADLFGYSMGASVALQMAVRHPDLVRKQVVASGFHHPDGYYPEALAGIQAITPEVFAGSPMEASYLQIAPNPDDFPRLIERVQEMARTFEGWPAAELEAIQAPTLIIVGDADVVRPEHAVELFRLLGGGVPGDLTGLPTSQLAILPGTTHVGVMFRTDWLLSMVVPFLAAPMPEGS